MKVTLLAHTQLSEKFYDSFDIYGEFSEYEGNKVDRSNATDGQIISLSAIRTCYSSNAPSEIFNLEGEKYFGKQASDGEGGTDADRLIRHIMKSGHTSTMEHLNFTFAVEGVSRSLLAQLTRHRHFSFSVQSQRYVKFGSDDKSGGMDYITPHTVNDEKEMIGLAGVPYAATEIYKKAMKKAQKYYDELREAGVPAEDARMVLPNAATCNLVMTGNLRSILDFCSKRLSKQAQHEIRMLAEKLRDEVVAVEPWTKSFFGK
ncbi:FAD-dependent thymidylate synthase [Priestia flexa]|uniref:Flavin-dependent thymidylate synthase n=1 Tax=Priestia flexa TaxID=86664 RepID=A0ABU4J254_9BACI|nr:FAD-dependent thymidylate synthase [Priestia flexa]MDW8515079.1 FAD-dependent thymidylate synthase [Priestia flexa]